MKHFKMFHSKQMRFFEPHQTRSTFSLSQSFKASTLSLTGNLQEII